MLILYNIYKLQYVTGYGLWIVDSGFWIMDSGLWIVGQEVCVWDYDSGLWVVDYGLWILNKHLLLWRCCMHTVCCCVIHNAWWPKTQYFTVFLHARVHKHRIFLCFGALEAQQMPFGMPLGVPWSLSQTWREK